MTTTDFVNKLHSLIDLGDRFRALVFFAMRGGDNIVLKKANILNNVLVEIAQGYRDSLIYELERFKHDDQMTVLNLSDRDERANVIYRYDLPDVKPSYFDTMKEPLIEPSTVFTGEKMFNFSRDSFSDVAYYVIRLGSEENQIIVYRDNFNVNLMKQSRGRFYLNKSGTQISKVDNDILRMDSQIDCMLIDNDYFIINLKNLDTSKEFATIIRDRASEAIDQISELPFINEVDGLRAHIVDDLSFARRLMRAMDSSPVTSLPPDDILGFIRNHRKLSSLLHIKEGKIELTTKKAQSAFVSLLNDDFLYSKLTQRDYESSSKDQLRV